jgi:4-carboxymuconolactone decarboxylase
LGKERTAKFMANAERLPPIAADRMSKEQRLAAEEFKAGRGYDPLGPFAVMLRSPEVMLRAKAMGDYLRFRNVLPKRVSEMVILLTAREWTQEFEWSHHYKFALEGGLSPAIIEAIADGRRPEAMAPDEAAAYDLVGELWRRKSVSDQTYARALNCYGEAGVIDLVGIVGYYSLLAMMMNVARTAPDTSTGLPLRRFPD